MLKHKRLESFWPTKTHLIAGQVAGGRLIETPPAYVFFTRFCSFFFQGPLWVISVCVYGVQTVFTRLLDFFIIFAGFLRLHRIISILFTCLGSGHGQTRFAFGAQTQQRDKLKTEIEKMHLLSMQTANRADNKYGRPPIFMAIKCVV